MGHDGNNVPACRAPAICYSLDLKNPPEESGLTKPLQASDLYELEYIDYSCINKGKTWSLLGEYQPVEDYIFNSNVAIIDGNLRINCVTNGVLGQVCIIFYISTLGVSPSIFIIFLGILLSTILSEVDTTYICIQL